LINLFSIYNNEYYINLIPSWRENLLKLQKTQLERYNKYIKLTELLKTADVKRQIDDLKKIAKADKIRIDQYIKQTSEPHIIKLKDALERYKRKAMLLA
jgi:hypothetical protein